MRHCRGAAPALVFLAAFAAGCSQQTLESAREDTERNVAVVKREAERAERKARPQLNQLEMKTKVTAALRLNKRLPDTIRVDPNQDGVRLRGTVKTTEQRDLAERIARDTLDDERTVANDIKLEGE